MSDLFESNIELILEEEGLTCTDPLAQKQLIQTVSEDQIPLRIVNRYEIRPDKIRCAVCGTDKKHNSGVTIEFQSGDLALSGRDCASRMFGTTSINKLFKDMEYRERAVTLHKFVAPAKKACQLAIESIEDQWLPVEIAITQFASKFNSNFSQQFKQIRREGPNARITVKLTDMHGDQRLERARLICKTRGHGQHREVGIDSVEVLTVVSTLSRYSRKLSKILERLDIESNGNKEFQDLNIERLKISTDLIECISKLKKSAKFFTDENLILLAAYFSLISSERIHFSFSKNRQLIEEIDMWGDKHAIEVPNLIGMDAFGNPGQMLKL